jgi:hypothetical protein
MPRTSISSGDIRDGAVADIAVAAGAAIDATKIAAGGVTSTEFGYLADVTSSVQDQINARVRTDPTSTAQNQIEQPGTGHIGLSIIDAAPTGTAEVILAVLNSVANPVFSVEAVDGASNSYVIVLGEARAGGVHGVVEVDSNAAPSVRVFDRAPVRLYDGDNAEYVGFRAPSSVSASYDLTLPAALPVSTKYLAVSSTGQLSFAEGSGGGGGGGNTYFPSGW